MSLLDDAERTRLDEFGNLAALTRPPGDASIPELFAEQVERTPDTVALTCEGRSWSYAELDEASNRLAHLLADLGAGPGNTVALLFHRSAEAIMAILAVLKIRGGLPADRPCPAGGPHRVHAR